MSLPKEHAILLTISYTPPMQSSAFVTWPLWVGSTKNLSLETMLTLAVAERGVVFFRAQDNLTNDLQKELILRMGELTGRPSTHGLHIHPVTNDAREFGDPDPQISTINSEGRKTLYKGSDYTKMAAVWHSDISFEKAPADFSSLRLVQLPKTGGDTLWASGYEIYDRISKPYRAFLETLSATHAGVGFMRLAQTGKFHLYEKERGAPVNVGGDLSAVHPVVRTNPITGWKSIFPIGSFPTQIDGLTRRESASMLQWFHDMITHGHDLQVRFKWNSPNDIGRCLCILHLTLCTDWSSDLGQSQRLSYRDGRP
ncbi:hypothetical protein BDV33DRAFT_103627 [Aspergillus novoparasiticus]|uniref:TauD/TfdA-like domain-containing protein n=1 Tax=Aspergillus novoparasiticus TaxID=986946 RepID=A0A5N6EQI7_9EURO|nr:hypothetical protein BDV33DRAFT_103627 [Aspergillus novoparasiticus]